MVLEGELSSEPAPLLGQRVVIGGLSSRPELNERRGVAQSFEGGRYAVALEGGGESVRVRPGNLSPAAAGQAPSGVVAVSDEVVAAVERGEEEAVLEWLEGRGRADATYERGGVSGLTLLMSAAHHRHERVVELLMRHGADVNLQDSVGGTALMYAAGQGHERVVNLLLRHGAEINLQSSNGGTALMTAAFFDHPAVVRRLLRAGADTAARSASGKTALQVAKEQGHAGCVEAFKKHVQEVLAGRPTATAAGGEGAGGASSGGASSAGSRVVKTPSPAAAAGRASSGGVAVSDEVVAAAGRGDSVQSLQRSVADLQGRMVAEISKRLSAEQQLSAWDGFEFEDGHRGSGNWRPILDQNAVQLLRTLQTHQSVRYTLGTNNYAASMSVLGEITQRNEVYGTTRCVRKIVPPQPWQRLPSPSRGPLTERWLALAGSWSTEQAVRQLFSRRCGSTLQLESITAVCHETSLTAFNAGSLGADADPNPNRLFDALLFHGTRTDGNVANILAEGLKLRFANASGMLGGGIYGAPDPRKASQYAPQGTHGRFMFLCRFNLAGSRHHQNMQFAEYCVYEESKVAVLWMLKIR